MRRAPADKKAMEEKKAKKAADKAAGGDGGKKNPGKPGTVDGPGKKGKKKEEDLSALLGEGLNVSGKKKK